jgi:hypothetical protein
VLADPVNPVDPVKPLDPVNPVGPATVDADPVKPVGPTGPVGPLGPAIPGSQIIEEASALRYLPVLAPAVLGKRLRRACGPLFAPVPPFTRGRTPLLTEEALTKIPELFDERPVCRTAEKETFPDTPSPFVIDTVLPPTIDLVIPVIVPVLTTMPV